MNLNDKVELTGIVEHSSLHLSCMNAFVAGATPGSGECCSRHHTVTEKLIFFVFHEHLDRGVKDALTNISSPVHRSWIDCGFYNGLYYR